MPRSSLEPILLLHVVEAAVCERIEILPYEGMIEQAR